MANPTSGRNPARAKSTGSRAKGRANKAVKPSEKGLQPRSNREVIYQKLEELTTPILDKYGVPAFDEVMNRLETTVKEFTKEVDNLFNELVTRSREEHERMKSLLVGNEGDEQDQEEELDNEAEMSDFEKRLERMEKKNTSKAETEGRK